MKPGPKPNLEVTCCDACQRGTNQAGALVRLGSVCLCDECVDEARAAIDRAYPDRHAAEVRA